MVDDAGDRPGRDGPSDTKPSGRCSRETGRDVRKGMQAVVRSMVKTILVLLPLAMPAGCGGGMSQAYSVLPNTFDDLARQTKAFRHHDGGKKEPQAARARTAGK